MKNAPVAVSGSIPYATPSPTPRRGTAPAVWIGLFGLALIGLGGCFCMGIMAILHPYVLFGGTPAPPPMTAGLVTFLIVLYGCAFGCFGGAVFLLQKGVRLLIGLINQ